MRSNQNMSDAGKGAPDGVGPSLADVFENATRKARQQLGLETDAEKKKRHEEESRQYVKDMVARWSAIVSTVVDDGAKLFESDEKEELHSGKTMDTDVQRIKCNLDNLNFQPTEVASKVPHTEYHKQKLSPPSSTAQESSKSVCTSKSWPWWGNQNQKELPNKPLNLTDLVAYQMAENRTKLNFLYGVVLPIGIAGTMLAGMVGGVRRHVLLFGTRFAIAWTHAHQQAYGN